MVKFFGKKVNSFVPLTFFSKESSIIDVWQGSKYVSSFQGGDLPHRHLPYKIKNSTRRKIKWRIFMSQIITFPFHLKTKITIWNLFVKNENDLFWLAFFRSFSVAPVFLSEKYARLTVRGS